METPPYIHLHTHSYFSFLCGPASPEQLVQAAVDQDMPAVALTDRHGLTGAIEFYLACQAKGIKPILGLELVVNHRLGSGDLIFLATDYPGWRSLCRLSSLVQTQTDRDPERGLDFSDLAEHNLGLICLTGGTNGLLQRKLPASRWQILVDLAAIFPDCLYVEIHNPTADGQLVALARELDIPLVATNPVYYLASEHANLQRTLSAMSLNCRLQDVPPEKIAPLGAYFTTIQQMKDRFRDLPEAIHNTRAITKRCNLILPLGKPHYPETSLSAGETADSRLRQLAEQGAKEIYNRITPEIQSRLDHELSIISERGYASLFLIVQEILAFACQIGVPISSRGSAASSLVAHCLGITSPDPLALDLYFERFLNPARAIPPDIDTDLCSRRRDEVLRHVYQKYGEERVAMVATINRFRPRSAIREVAKAYGVPSREIGDLVERLPWRGWGSPSRRNEWEDPFKGLKSQTSDSRMRAILQDAEAVLGFPRHLSVHPGGIVITPSPMTDLVPIHLASKGILITQFDLEAIEKMGLVKIDLLGTRGLTVLGDVAERVRSWQMRDFKSALDVLKKIPDDDPDTAALVKSAQTIGCFQIESPGMRATLKEINAQSPEDIMIALALYRPGPMTGGLKSTFVRRHLGQEDIEHLHPALATLLQDTYGVILYQEQVLLIASQLAGLSLADADLLRRAMSHFDPGERMKTLKIRFIRGAEQKSGVPPETGEHIWELMAAFAGYGFPKAHAASYAQVSWRSAWCKSHYPAEFMAAVLAGWGGYYRQRVYLNEARRLGLPVNPPDIQFAEQQFAVKYPQGIPTLFMGLDQVRDLTRRTQSRIRKERPFSSLVDFLTRVDPKYQEAENLIRVGGLKTFGTIPDLLSQIRAGKWSYRQPPLFDLLLERSEPEWDLAKRIEAQLEILGASVDAHPLELVADRISEETISTPEALTMLDETIQVAGVRQTIQRFFAHEGDPFYILELEDMEGVLPIMMTPEFYRRRRNILSSSNPFWVEGKMVLSPTSGEPVLQARRLQSI